MEVDLPEVHVERAAPGRVVVAFRGEHDLSHAEALSERLATLVRENELVVADFSDARFVDSSVINVLVQTKREADVSGSRFRLQMGTECVVYRVFELAGVLSFLECASSREEALGNDSQAGE